MQMYLECVEGAVVGPDAGAASGSEVGEGSMFSSDFYAPGDSRTPKVVAPMLSRFGIVGKKKKKKSRKSY